MVLWIILFSLCNLKIKLLQEKFQVWCITIKTAASELTFPFVFFYNIDVLCESNQVSVIGRLSVSHFCKCVNSTLKAVWDNFPALPANFTITYFWLLQQFCLESTSTLECKFILGIMYLPNLMPAVFVHLLWFSFFADAISVTIFLDSSHVFHPPFFTPSFNKKNILGIMTIFYSE